MAVIKVNLDPTQRQLKQFAWMWLAFFGALGGVVLWRPGALVGAAIFMAVAVTASLVLNAESPRPRQLWGLLLPGVFGLAGQSAVAGVPALSVASVLWGVGGLFGVAAMVGPAVCRKMYIGWMWAAEPIGWTISHAILGIVFYLVITPIGLVMRGLGRDPMQRKFDRQATTYWQVRQPVTDVKRYYRQF